MNELLVFEMSLRVVAMLNRIGTMRSENIPIYDYTITHERTVLERGEDLMDDKGMERQAYLRNRMMADDAVKMQIALGNIGVEEGSEGVCYRLTDKGARYADGFNDDMFDHIQKNMEALKNHTVDELKERIEKVIGGTKKWDI